MNVLFLRSVANLLIFFSISSSQSTEATFNNCHKATHSNVEPIKMLTTGANNKITNSQTLHTATDEIEQFFLCVSRNLRKFPERDQVKLKMDITNLVFQAQLKNYSSAENTSVPLFSVGNLSPTCSTLTAYTE